MSPSGPEIQLRDVGMRFSVSAASERRFQSLFRVFRRRAPARHVDALRGVSLEIRRGKRGMFVRLAFSATTAVDAEILLLDEVMAAGDLDFAARAQRRMMEMTGRGEIVVLSSHALEELASICQRIVWLERGRVRMDGPGHEVVGHYREHVSRLAAEAGGLAEATASAAGPDSAPRP